MEKLKKKMIKFLQKNAKSRMQKWSVNFTPPLKKNDLKEVVGLKAQIFQFFFNVYSHLRDRPFFSWEILRLGKNCLHEKTAEINCLQRAPLSCEVGELKKNCLHSEWRKNFASAESMVEKTSCLLEITIPSNKLDTPERKKFF